MARDAILRNLTVIGEAVRTLPDRLVAELPLPYAAASRGLRNVIVHEYFRIGEDVVAGVVTTQLPKMALLLLETAWTVEALGSSEQARHRLPLDPEYSAIERWCWRDTGNYITWLENTLPDNVLDRERTRLITRLETDLEELVAGPWAAVYDSPDGRDADNDYHYFNQAPMDLGSTDHYDRLWHRYLMLWHAYNRGELSG
jgi:hypothetical protein